jgi:hypothetical protein
MKPCIECGEPSNGTRCDEHRREHQTARRGSARGRGYDRTWDKLSLRARKAQPFCSDCFTTENLTTDHKASAWRRKAEGKTIRLRDVDVVCGPCNTRRGSSRPGSDQGTGTEETGRGPRGKPLTPLHTEDGSR